MHTVIVLAGVALIFAGAVVAGKMLGSSEPFEPLVPCTLGVVGFGVFGFGLFLATAPAPVGQCEVVPSEEDDEESGDADEAGDGSQSD